MSNAAMPDAAMLNAPTTLRDHLAAQRRFVATRAPVYAALLALLEAELDRGLEARLEEAWRARTFGAFYERPLLLLAALRDEALHDGPAHPLWRAVAAPEPDASALSRAAVADALAPERTRLWRLLAERRLQTNEPSRAVAWLWPARIASEVEPERAFALFDVGASAGLNLIADHLPPLWELDDGTPLEVVLAAPVVERTGFDLHPLDALDDDDARWLRACVWPGQGDREVRLMEALEVFRRLQAEEGAPVVRPARAREVPERLPVGEDGRLALVYQTIVRDYLPTDEWEAYRDGLLRWIEHRPRGSAVWVELEVTPDARSGAPPAAITVHVRGEAGPRALTLAHCEPHPRRLTVHPEAVAELRSALAS